MKNKKENFFYDLFVRMPFSIALLFTLPFVWINVYINSSELIIKILCVWFIIAYFIWMLTDFIRFRKEKIKEKR